MFRSRYSEIMAGKAKTREMEQKIEAAGGAAWLLTRVTEGKTLISLADELGVSRQIISGLLNSEEHLEALRNARKMAASVLAEESIDIADSATPESVQVDKLRVETRRWTASKWDREVFGEIRGPVVQISLAQLHIDALRRVSPTEAAQMVPTLAVTQ
jgi:hypothetical protein